MWFVLLRRAMIPTPQKAISSNRRSAKPPCLTERGDRYHVLGDGPSQAATGWVLDSTHERLGGSHLYGSFDNLATRI